MVQACYIRSDHDYDYLVVRKNNPYLGDVADIDTVFEVQIRSRADKSVEYAYDHANPSYDVACELADILAQNQVEPNQAKYVVEDYFTGMHHRWTRLVDGYRPKLKH